MRRRTFAIAAALAAALAAPAGADERAAERRRDVRAVQKRLFSKAGRWEAGLYSGIVPNDAFVNYVPVGLRAGRHVTERWGAELQLAYLLASDSELRTFLEEQDADLTARVRDRQQLRLDLAALWSPLYGKIAIGRRILHFDAYLLAGLGALRTITDPDNAAIEAPHIVPEGEAGLGLRTYFTRRFSLRIEWRQYLYMRPDSDGNDDGGLSTPSELTLGVAALLGK